ncbi:flagellar hook-basal body protein [Ferroacidibacillus organovorans]|uniref:Uncharacterized protein n=1 Tax=Ferroacidibacillus organovorans TaxID=1765683 RepID=A0A1V4EUX4_9BACL|nr:flagellar hook-basal body protein [Ferroacidibacillus organovorans]OPG16701.1 hypothetical protein B2M26_04890 [Ferroacidibacillus organovorans]
MGLLSTAASGLQAQTNRLDMISNNIANLDTVGYQSVDTNFANTLTQVYGQSPVAANVPGRQSPPGLSLGTGVYALTPTRSFTQGAIVQTGNPLDFAIGGGGFFTVRAANGQAAYTRAGQMQWSVDGRTGHMILTNQNGNPLLLSNGRVIDGNAIQTNTLSVSPSGVVTAKSTAGAVVRLGQLGLVAVAHPGSALHSLGADLYGLNPGYTATPITAGAAAASAIGQVQSGALEMSNVNLTDQMTSMVVTQHDFGMASQAVNIADKMMGLANSL